MTDLKRPQLTEQAIAIQEASDSAARDIMLLIEKYYGLGLATVARRYQGEISLIINKKFQQLRREL